VYRTTSPAEIAAREAQYDGAIAYMDAQLDRLLGDLRRRGLLDNTIVVVVSDHGEHWGDHRRLSHGNTLYRQLLQVPLVIRYPARVPAGTVVTEPVSLVDLPATVRDLAGLPRGTRFPGASLALRTAGAAEAPAAATRPIVSENAPRGVPGPLSVITGGLHYIRNTDGTEELYDVARDPGDAVDLARTGAGLSALPRVRAAADSVATGRR
jgi:arylsulfatase A-like enzyme